MKRMMRLAWGTAMAVLLIGRTFAQVDDIRRHPGYVNLEWVPIPEHAEDVMDMTIGPRLIRVMEKSDARHRQTAAADIERIHSLQVKAFDVDTVFAQKILPLMNRMEETLKHERWQSVIRMKNQNRFTNVSIKLDRNQKMEGFFIMSLDPGSEVSFVNIVGEVDFDRLRNMKVNLNENALDSLRRSMEKTKRNLQKEALDGRLKKSSPPMP